MANINDYLLWRGDLQIDEKNKINEIDYMILARCSYLRFDKIKMEQEETFETASNKMKDLKDEEFLFNGDKELITYLGKSERFKNMIITDYIKTSDKENEKQFGAITIHLSNETMYISFIGTDSTINGWKEDFNMAFMEHVPCQLAGKEYLEKIAKKYNTKSIVVGGHSKGGNVAIYSALTCDKSVQDRIIKVNNYDGPGFKQKFVETYENYEMVKKIETFIPQDSIIGRMLNHKEKITIIYSTEKGIMQHDIYSWQVLKDEVLKLEKNTQTSEDINDTLNKWLETTTDKQRELFFNTIFEIINSTEAETFGDISSSLTTSIPMILKKYKEISSEDKKALTKMTKIFASSYLNILKQKKIIIIKK